MGPSINSLGTAHELPTFGRFEKIFLFWLRPHRKADSAHCHPEAKQDRERCVRYRTVILPPKRPRTSHADCFACSAVSSSPNFSDVTIPAQSRRGSHPPDSRTIHTYRTLLTGRRGRALRRKPRGGYLSGGGFSSVVHPLGGLFGLGGGQTFPCKSQ